MTKIVAIGVGSLVFGVELLRDVYQTPELRGAELWLVDLDPGALRRMGGLAEKLNEASGWDVTLRTTPERVEALPGADYVVTSIAVDPAASRTRCDRSRRCSRSRKTSSGWRRPPYC